MKNVLEEEIKLQHLFVLLVKILDWVLTDFIKIEFAKLINIFLNQHENIFVEIENFDITKNIINQTINVKYSIIKNNYDHVIYKNEICEIKGKLCQFLLQIKKTLIFNLFFN